MLTRSLIVFFLLCSIAHADRVLENEPSLTPGHTHKTEEADEVEDPLIEADDIIQKREEKTISASVNAAGADYRRMDGSETLEGLQSVLIAEEELSALEKADSPRQGLREIVIAFSVEILVTLFVLSITFQICGFPCAFRQLFSLSLAVALFGAVLDTLISLPLLHPLRALAGLVILIGLIRPFTEVAMWSTAVKIGIITRLISLAIIWLIVFALNALGSL